MPPIFAILGFTHPIGGFHGTSKGIYLQNFSRGMRRNVQITEKNLGFRDFFDFLGAPRQKGHFTLYGGENIFSAAKIDPRETEHTTPLPSVTRDEPLFFFSYGNLISSKMAKNRKNAKSVLLAHGARQKFHVCYCGRLLICRRCTLLGYWSIVTHSNFSGWGGPLRVVGEQPSFFDIFGPNSVLFTEFSSNLVKFEQISKFKFHLKFNDTNFHANFAEIFCAVRVGRMGRAAVV